MMIGFIICGSVIMDDVPLHQVVSIVGPDETVETIADPRKRGYPHFEVKLWQHSSPLRSRGGILRRPMRSTALVLTAVTLCFSSGITGH